MIKFEETEVLGWTHAIRGMRNPKNSWSRSDSNINVYGEGEIGPNDLKLMKSLCHGGSDDRKFMRMIVVYVDITAPLYWWKEFDTYKVGTVSNSCSTMHKIHSQEFTLDDFSHEHLLDGYDEPFVRDEKGYGWTQGLITLESIIGSLNAYRYQFSKEKAKQYWWNMIQLLPTSYNQKRTILLNYEVLSNMYHARKFHKLDEWSIGFCTWVRSLPYSELITGEE